MIVNDNNRGDLLIQESFDALFEEVVPVSVGDKNGTDFRSIYNTHWGAPLRIRLFFFFLSAMFSMSSKYRFK